MIDKQIIIDDQKKTIHRLQQECTEKTNAIIALGEQLKRKEQEFEALYKVAKTHLAETFEMQKELDQLKSDNKHLNGLLDQALKELEEHRNVFEKVKELIQKEINDCEHCEDCASCEYNCCTRQILQI